MPIFVDHRLSSGVQHLGRARAAAARSRPLDHGSAASARVLPFREVLQTKQQVIDLVADRLGNRSREAMDGRMARWGSTPVRSTTSNSPFHPLVSG